ncbi:protein kinase domain-containing protein [Diplodia corticola]|uniref:Protein kinase domain-containing protein n=1 Tax=Diplodia corticola TaxID=236234 RepID=A0A1J9QQW1_9PEZI|nr:protein kinase domain-containing protein [Diplodia corticola]OJD30402.1 protein kinase domain-containing protein [Diplodia corticola]
MLQRTASFHDEKTEEENAQIWNAPVLQKRSTADDISFDDQHPLLDVEYFDHDVDTCLISSTDRFHSPFLCEWVDIASIGSGLEATRLGPPKSVMEDTGDMKPWLDGIYTPGFNSGSTARKASLFDNSVIKITDLCRAKSSPKDGSSVELAPTLSTSRENPTSTLRDHSAFLPTNPGSLKLDPEPRPSKQLFVSDKSLSQAKEADDADNEVKGHVFDKLVQRAYHLLGYSPSDVSETISVSSSSSPKECAEESSDRSIASHGHGTRAEELYSRPVDAGSSSQGKSNAKRTETGARTSDSTVGSPLSNSAETRKRDSPGDEPNGDDGRNGNKRRRGPKSCNGSRRGPSFDTISRLKEHLYRVHMGSAEGDSICPRCRQTFESALDLVRHLARADRCVEAVVPRQEYGLGQDQVDRLRSRDRGVDPEDKWRHIYRICHRLPDDAETPSPCKFFEARLSHCADVIGRLRSGISGRPGSRGYDWYQRQHLPGLIQEQLEREPDIRDFVERFGERLPAIIRDCQNNLHRRFIGPRRSVDATDNVQSTIRQQNSDVKGLASHQHPATLPVAFEAAPNTDDGMTSSKVRQVHALSVQGSDRDSDSAYGSSVFGPLQSELPYEQGHSNSKPTSSHDMSHPESFARQQQPSQSCHDLPEISVDDSVQESNVQIRRQASAADHVGSLQLSDYSQSPFSLGQSFLPQNGNPESNTGGVTWQDDLDWSLFEDSAPGTKPSFDYPMLCEAEVTDSLDPDFDFEGDAN